MQLLSTNTTSDDNPPAMPVDDQHAAGYQIDEKAERRYYMYRSVLNYAFEHRTSSSFGTTYIECHSGYDCKIALTIYTR